VLERLEAAVALLREATEIAEIAHIGCPRLKIDANRYDTGSVASELPGDVSASFRRIVDRDAWGYLLGESGVRSLMDAKARKQWDAAVDAGRCPALTADNIAATFCDLHGARGEMFERGVINCFKELSWHYKTNLPQKFGKRIVMRYLRGKVSGPTRSLGYLNHGSCDQLDDLVRVFSILDGKAEPDHRHGMYQLVYRVGTLDDGDAEHEYLTIRCFKNGNAHVTFKRMDLTGKGTLPFNHRCCASSTGSSRAI
jgi:Domain of unknown function (DUF4942)